MPKPTIQQILGVPQDVPIREMKKAWAFHLQARDLKKAERWCPTKCPIAIATRRQTGLPTAIFSEVAYLVLQNDGVQFIGKFSIPKKMRRALQHFDKTGEFDMGKLWELTPLYFSKLASTRRERNKLLAQRKRLGLKPTAAQVKAKKARAPKPAHRRPLSVHSAHEARIAA